LGCIRAGEYLDVKVKRLFYGDENPERLCAEQDTVADCCEQLKGHLQFPQKEGDFLNR